MRQEWTKNLTIVLLPFGQRQKVLLHTLVGGPACHGCLWGGLEHLVEFNNSRTLRNLLLWRVSQGVAVLIAQLPVDFHIWVMSHHTPRSKQVVEWHVPFVRLAILQIRQIASHVDHVEVVSIFERLSRRRLVPATLVVSACSVVVTPIAPVFASIGLVPTFSPVVGGVAMVINVSWRLRWTVMVAPAGS
jgi:hypothetical protein